MNRILPILLSLSLAGTAAATPRVVTSIPPVYGLVADVMRGAGTPTLLMEGATSPHHFALRPSQASDLAEADIVFAIGLGIDFWVPENGRAHYVYLGNSEDLTHHNFRDLKEFSEIDEFEHDDHDIDHSLEYEAEEEHFDATDPEVDAFINNLIGESEPLHDDHDDHDDHDEHDDDHDHSGTDPHVWLDPRNAIMMVDAITAALTEVDLVNEAIYRDNASQVKRDIVRAAERARFSVDRLSGIDFVTTHDSLQYFERAFDLHVVGALSSADGILVGARSLSSIYQQIGTGSCLLVDITEPGGVAGNPFGEVPTIEVDPLGSALTSSANYYPRLLETLAESLSNCRQ